MKKILPIILCIFIINSLQSQSYRSVNFEGAGWVTAVKYAADGTRIYARTDVGGAYRSDDGGANWNFMSQYAQTLAGLYVQGLAIHPTNKDIVYLCCGTSYRDTDPGHGVWKTTDGGASWTQVLSTVNFSGNDDIRWGGECILIDPSNPGIVYCGGIGSGIYKTTDGGSTWNQIVTPATVSGNISTITLKPGTSGSTAEIWVGSATGSSPAGIWKTTNAGGSWTQMRNNTQVQDVVFRIAVKSDGTVFAAYNESLTKFSGGVWADITGFSTGQGNFCAVNFMGSENTIVAGRMDYTRLSTDGGQTFPTVLPLTLLPPLPGHSHDWPVVEWARNEFMQNPANASEWYMSGGFGCIKSTDGGQNWHYATHGINIPVMYKTYFHATDPNYIYLPMGDLTMGRITNGGSTGEITDYAFFSFNIQQDFSNGTAVMTTPVNPSKHYLAGGNVYQNENNGVFLTTNNGANYTRQTAAGLPTTANRPIISGVASNTNENQLIVFVGGDYSNIGTVGGIYWSTDAGSNFTRANGIPTNVIGPGVYYSNYGIGKDPVNTLKRYAYLEGDGGGFFESNDEGRNWTLKNQVTSGYKNAGTLVIHPTIPNLFYISQSFSGLYVSTDAGTTWNNMSGWTEASEVDAIGNTIVAFGSRTGDTYDKLYKSTNSGTSWQEISDANHRLPNITGLTINPYNTNQLWISTTGTGTYIFDGLTIGVKTISTEIPKTFSMFQNYPNPFNPSSKIKFEIAKLTNVKLTVYDLLGKEVEVLINKQMQPGTYESEFDGSRVSSGIYFYMLTAGDYVSTKKMVLVK